MALTGQIIDNATLKTIEKNIVLREWMLTLVDALDEEQLFKIPQGFNNNIAWNFAHLCTSQQLLQYKISGLPLLIDEKTAPFYRKGSSPKDWLEKPSFAQIKSDFITLIHRLQKDYESGLFVNYSAYTTSTGVVLNDIKDAIAFNLFHEGTHAGVVLSLKRLVTQ